MSSTATDFPMPFVRSFVFVQVIMATNRADTLDPALLRPGRLDRKIEFPVPDRRQKRMVFTACTGKMNLSEVWVHNQCKLCSFRQVASCVEYPIRYNTVRCVLVRIRFDFCYRDNTKKCELFRPAARLRERARVAKWRRSSPTQTREKRLIIATTRE